MPNWCFGHPKVVMMSWIIHHCPHGMFQGPEITLKQLFKDSFCSLKSFGIVQNLQQNFWTWVWPMFKKLLHCCYRRSSLSSIWILFANISIKLNRLFFLLSHQIDVLLFCQVFALFGLFSMSWYDVKGCSSVQARFITSEINYYH